MNYGKANFISRADKLPEKSAEILANSIFKNLQNQGCNSHDIIRISSHLLGLVNQELQEIDD